jgi:hypothetical protein
VLEKVFGEIIIGWHVISRLAPNPDSADAVARHSWRQTQPLGHSPRVSTMFVIFV